MFVAVGVDVLVRVGVGVGVFVAVKVWVGVGVFVGVLVAVFVGVGVGVVIVHEGNLNEPMRVCQLFPLLVVAVVS